MITYEEAKGIATRLNGRVNACNEYAKGFHFFEETDDDVDGDSGVVILKSNGRALSFVPFLLNYHPERTPKRIDF